MHFKIGVVVKMWILDANNNLINLDKVEVIKINKMDSESYYVIAELDGVGYCLALCKTRSESIAFIQNLNIDRIWLDKK